MVGEGENAVAGQKKRGNFVPHGRNEHKRQKLSLMPGVRGVLVTCPSSRTRDAVREVMTLLNNFSQREEENAKNVEKSEGVVDVEKQIEAEKQSLLDENSKRFYFIPDVTKGVGFIRFNRDADDPSIMIERILEEARDPSATSIRCRFASRVIPVQTSCKPHVEEFRSCLTPLIAKYFPRSAAASTPGSEETSKSEEDVSPDMTTWAVQFTARHGMKTLPRETVTTIAGDLVGAHPSYKVNLSNPDITIVVEVNPLICAISVCRNFFSLKKYNLYRLCHPEEEDKKKTVENNTSEAQDEQQSNASKGQEDAEETKAQEK